MAVLPADPEITIPVLDATVPDTPVEIATPEPLEESTPLMPRRKKNPFREKTPRKVTSKMKKRQRSMG
jgi:hypothetical protein